MLSATRTTQRETERDYLQTKVATYRLVGVSGRCGNRHRPNQADLRLSRPERQRRPHGSERAYHGQLGNPWQLRRSPQDSHRRSTSHLRIACLLRRFGNDEQATSKQSLQRIRHCLQSNTRLLNTNKIQNNKYTSNKQIHKTCQEQVLHSGRSFRGIDSFARSLMTRCWEFATCTRKLILGRAHCAFAGSLV